MDIKSLNMFDDYVAASHWPESKAEDVCACCGHRFDEHKNGGCRGVPSHPSVDVDGECPCNGFEPTKNWN